MSMSKRQLLSSLVQTAESLSIALAKRCLDVEATTPLTSIPPLRLDSAIGVFQSDILELEIPSLLSRKASEAVTELAKSYQESYERAASRVAVLPSSPRSLCPRETLVNLRNTIETVFKQDDLPKILTDLKRAAEELKAKQSTYHHCQYQKVNERRTFNQEYTPLLEKYFEYNAYPSAPDRLLLARKSMMTPRQIEVWFQNHRTRARKDGLPLRKLTSHPLPVHVSLEALERSMPQFTIPAFERQHPERGVMAKKDDLVISKAQPNPAIDILDIPGSPHAFPTVFSPNSPSNIFSVDGIYTFPPPKWFRRPAAKITSYSAVDVDDLIDSFATKLHLREAAASKKDLKEEPSSIKAARLPWFTATVTVPPSAPHPALIQPSPWHLICSAPHSPVTLEADKSPTFNLTPSRRRKPSGLPKRTPVAARRRGSPATPQPPHFPSPCPAPLSRHPSCASSSASSGTSSPPSPLTPPCSPPHMADTSVNLFPSSKYFTNEHCSMYGFGYSTPRHFAPSFYTEPYI